MYFHAFCLQYLSFMWIFVKLWNCVWIWYYEIKRLLFYLTWILRKYEIINSNVWLRKISNCVYASLSPWIILPAKSDRHSKGVGSRERGASKQRLHIYILHVWKPKQRNSNINMNQHFQLKMQTFIISTEIYDFLLKIFKNFYLKVVRKHKFEQNGKFNMTLYKSRGFS